MSRLWPTISAARITTSLRSTTDHSISPQAGSPAPGSKAAERKDTRRKLRLHRSPQAGRGEASGPWTRGVGSGDTSPGQMTEGGPGGTKSRIPAADTRKCDARQTGGRSAAAVGRAGGIAGLRFDLDRRLADRSAAP